MALDANTAPPPVVVLDDGSPRCAEAVRWATAHAALPGAPLEEHRPHRDFRPPVGGPAALERPGVPEPGVRGGRPRAVAREAPVVQRGRRLRVPGPGRYPVAGTSAAIEPRWTSTHA